ncbi:exo-beta-N-acetylmuramidase NamZ family protein [Haploplasma axanthum]|uniref:Uncharacterized protein conserved in bacteria n=1 Tax=Haploplasma axanthum TaxID=29552 RepID=A0A449BD00_HAPAX|nr:DUF1343 domain-containing protein [Haploplasma axanthum]VEU80305.1 Uncharacterized protein conserved in bacteria [Haploplasma axanthum]
MKLGIERIDEFINIFKNKRVGLITNPTGVDKDLKTSVDILNEKVKLTALFAPEHGIRGNIEAGEKLSTYIDEVTNLTVYSLYGETRKPTKEMLSEVDVLCFDIQDVGARFYTYIYTMAYSMIAAKELNKEFVVFDRPNPLGGKIEGNILDLKYRSFIGYYEIPQRHGLTIGELAQLFNEEYKIGVKLHVIPMFGWKSDMEYSDLNRNWILPSPNLPTLESAYIYLSTCIFEGTNVSEGRGTTKPFSFIGAPWLNNRLIIRKLREFNVEGVVFREVYFKPTFSKYKDELCNGIEFIVTDFKKFRPVYFGMILIILIRDNHEEFKFNKPYSEGREPMINLNIGSNYIKDKTKNLDEIKEMFQVDDEIFEKIRRRYRLYD